MDKLKYVEDLGLAIHEVVRRIEPNTDPLDKISLNLSPFDYKYLAGWPHMTCTLHSGSGSMCAVFEVRKIWYGSKVLKII